MLNCLWYEDRRRFLEDGFEIVIVVTPFLIHVFFPERIEVEMCRFLFNLETCPRNFIILNFVNVMSRNIRLGGNVSRDFTYWCLANICTVGTVSLRVLVNVYLIWTSIMHWLKAVYYMVPKHGDLQKIIKDGWKLQKWMPWEDPPEYQEKTELEM